MSKEQTKDLLKFLEQFGMIPNKKTLQMNVFAGA